MTSAIVSITESSLAQLLTETTASRVDVSNDDIDEDKIWDKKSETLPNIVDVSDDSEEDKIWDKKSDTLPNIMNRDGDTSPPVVDDTTTEAPENRSTKAVKANSDVVDPDSLWGEADLEDEEENDKLWDSA